jgi:hypothetical protein
LTRGKKGSNFQGMEASREFSDSVHLHLRIFFWDFKRMDNVIYNFEILYYLYSLGETNWRRQRFLIKPLVIIQLSIVECIIFDFLKRVNEHTNETISFLDRKKINEVQIAFRELLRRKKGKARYITFDEMINLITTHNLLNKSVEKLGVYAELKKLKVVRNKIHIQNGNSSLDEKEFNIFTKELLREAEQIVEVVVKTLAIYYPRPNKIIADVNKFPFPWRIFSLV